MRSLKKKRTRSALHFKWLFTLLSIVLVSSSIIGYHLAAVQARNQLAQKCQALAATVSAIISKDSDGYQDFLSNMNMDSPYYKNTKQLMMQLKNVNEDHVAYIYTAIQVDDTTAMYVIGGEHPDSPVYTAPGVTDVLSEPWKTAFNSQSTVLGEDFIESTYGTRLSSYAPIFHSDTGEFLGLVGADVIQSQYNSIMHSFMIQTAFGLFIGILVFAIAIRWFSKNVDFLLNKERYEAEVARSFVSSGRKHYQRMDELHEKLRILKHDYKYHLRSIRNLLQTGNTQQADDYLTEIESKLTNYEIKSYCTNSVINALIADYDERCRQKEITFDVNIQLLKTLTVSDYDLCVVLGNLLENAVNACEKLPENRFIKLETQNTSNQIIFRIKNTFDGNIIHKGDIPISNKSSGGLGLLSVKEVIDSYGGDILFEWNKEFFTVYVAVNLV